jgi:putative ABC transport system permease protein
MIRTYFKTALRNLLKHKGFSAINIFGLAIGLAAFGLISLYVIDELSFDKYHKNADRIFRVVQHGKWSSGTFDLAVTSAPYAQALKNDYIQVEQAARINTEGGGGKITYLDKQIDGGSIFLADNSVFKIFSYTFLSGSAETALKAPQSIVLTKSLAIKLFGDASQALNKTIYFGGNYPNTVSGVIDDVPQNSQFTFNALQSFDTNYTGAWNNAELYTYVLLKNPSDAKSIESGSTRFYNKYLKDALANITYNMELQPLTSIHLHSKLGYELGQTGNITYIYVFSIVALLILIIAVINYVNLTTARSSSRVKEIGVRKVIGSGRNTLMLMFFSESVLLALIATAIAMVIMQFFMPYFNQISGKALSFSQIGIPTLSFLAFIFAVITGVLSGIYPALFLSGFKTIPAMKGQLGDQSSTVLFRQSLVTFQFVVAIVMIAGSLIIYQQLKYVSTKDLGFNKAQTLTFHINKQSVRGQVDAIKKQLMQNPRVESVGVAGNPIGNNDLGTHGFNPNPQDNTAADSKSVQNLQVDADFIPTMEIKLTSGRNFSPDLATDKTDAVIINETLVKELGWRNPVGRKAMTDGKLKTVIGVVRDFNTYSLQHKITPVVLSMPLETNDQDNLYVRIGKDNTQATLDYISKAYAAFDQENKAEFHFLDENFARQYQSEQKQGSLLMIFTVLAITLASLGLFGLVAFSAQQRIKEIGVRKVLGASVTSITVLLSRDLMELVALAMFIAVPVSIWAMSSWLNNFAYRINIQWWVYALSGLLAFAIALFTVGFQAIKAALMNPVKSLKAE